MRADQKIFPRGVSDWNTAGREPHSYAMRTATVFFSAAIFATFGVAGPAEATSPPTFNVANGIYSNPGAMTHNPITITGPAGSTVYYTTDGSQPSAGSTTSIQWKGLNLPINSTTQVNAIAVISGVSSTVASAFYVLDPRIFAMSTSNLLGWYGDCYGPAVSGAVGLWPDLSGAGNDLTQTTGGNQPSLTDDACNGVPVMNFNGTSSYFQVPSMTLNNSGLSLFAVVDATSLAANAQILNISGSPAPDNLVALGESSSNAPQFTIYNSSGSSPTTVTGSSPLTAGQYHLIEIVQGDIATTTCTMYIDGVQVAQNTAMNQVPAATLANNFLGRSSSGGSYFTGNVAQLILFSAPLTVSQRVAMEAYLMNAFQIASLVPTTPILSTATGTLPSPQQIAISAQPNTTIHITQDGTTPSATSPVYVGPVQVNYSQTLKAVAISNSGSQSSSIASATYTLDATLWPAPAAGGPTLQFNLTQPSIGIP